LVVSKPLLVSPQPSADELLDSTLPQPLTITLVVATKRCWHYALNRSTSTGTSQWPAASAAWWEVTQHEPAMVSDRLGGGNGRRALLRGNSTGSVICYNQFGGIAGRCTRDRLELWTPRPPSPNELEGPQSGTRRPTETLIHMAHLNRPDAAARSG